MTRLAVMQPYFFPYLGYFQLIHASDVFIFYDDVHFKKQGWINRNRLMNNGRETFFTIPCKKISPNRFINEIEIDWSDRNSRRLLNILENSYRRAPFFNEIMELTGRVMQTEATTISELAITSVRETCAYLGLKLNDRISSKRHAVSERDDIISPDDYSDTDRNGRISTDKNTDSYGIDRNSTDRRTISNPNHIKASQQSSNSDLNDMTRRIIRMADEEGAGCYINSTGGRELYSKDDFKEHGIELLFLQPQEHTYPQNSEPFVPWLSILDILMHCDTEFIKSRLLPSYKLI